MKYKFIDTTKTSVNNDWRGLLKNIAKNNKIIFSETPKRITRKQFMKMLKGSK